MARIHCANAQSTANSFIQLARRSYTTTPQTSTPLEFLIPRCTPPSRLRTPHITVAQSRTYAHPRRSWDFKSRETATRQFSTTAIREKTRAILNPQQDEDGNEMMLEITERAAKVIARSKDPMETLLTLKASKQDHGKGWQPEPCPKDSSREWWLPWLPISHEPCYFTSQGRRRVVIYRERGRYNFSVHPR